MKLGYTEFSYGYAFTENLIRSSPTGPATAPMFPNLVQEAKLGYDVRVDLPGAPLYFQFKLPTLLTRDTAREIVDRLAGLSVNFFRMPLMRKDKSDQHKHLIDLERRRPNAVFYASPLMETVDDFNRAYAAAAVHAESAYFSPIDIGPLPDSAEHSVSYKRSSAIAWRCSEPRKVTQLRFSDVIAKAQDDLSKRDGERLEDSVRKIREEVDPLLPRELLSAEPGIRERVAAREGARAAEISPSERTRAVTIDLLVARELVRVGLGLEMIIAQPRSS